MPNKPIIQFNPPDNTEYFIYVAPAPIGKTYEQVMEDPERVFMIDKKEVKAILIDALIYPFKSLSQYHCMAAYGMSTEMMKKHLKAKWNTLKPESRIAFFLFKKI